MALRITLKPHERVIINGAMIRAGDRSSYILVENQCRFLRETDFVDEHYADTMCKKLCLIVQSIHLSDKSEALMIELSNLSTRIKATHPEMNELVDKIEKAVSNNETYLAVKTGKQLMAREVEIFGA